MALVTGQESPSSVTQLKQEWNSFQNVTTINFFVTMQESKNKGPPLVAATLQTAEDCRWRRMREKCRRWWFLGQGARVKIMALPITADLLNGKYFSVWHITQRVSARLCWRAEVGDVGGASYSASGVCVAAAIKPINQTIAAMELQLCLLYNHQEALQHLNRNMPAAAGWPPLGPFVA